MKALLVLNPLAGRGDMRGELRRAVRYLEDQGWQITLRETRGKGDATAYARQAVAGGYQAVVVVGGDGTINESIQPLVGTDMALGVMPIGTGNVWAAEIGLLPTPTPLHRPHLLAAAQALVEGQTRLVDLGRASSSHESRYFLLWAGIGFDARVTDEIEFKGRPMKRRLGALAYIIYGALVARDFVDTQAYLELDGQTIERRVLLVLVSNAQLYGGVVRIAPEARLDDGWLDVCLFRGEGITPTIRYFVEVLAQRHLKDPEVEYHRVKRVGLQTEAPLLVQVDGEPIGTTPMEFSVVPSALKVVVPKRVPEGLFER